MANHLATSAGHLRRVADEVRETGELGRTVPCAKKDVVTSIRTRKLPRVTLDQQASSGVTGASPASREVEAVALEMSGGRSGACF